jgi:hypothetical protein
MNTASNAYKTLNISSRCLRTNHTTSLHAAKCKQHVIVEELMIPSSIEMSADVTEKVMEKNIAGKIVSASTGCKYVHIK